MSSIRALLLVVVLALAASAFPAAEAVRVARPIGAVDASAFLEVVAFDAAAANATVANATVAPAPNATSNSTAPAANATASAAPAGNATALLPPPTTAVNSTTPAGNSTAANGTTPAGNATTPAPAANGTTAANSTAAPAGNSTAPAGNATVPVPAANATAPAAGGNGTAANSTGAPAGNSTTPAGNATVPVPAANGTTPAGNSTAAPAGNSTTAGNATTAGNSTVPVPGANATAGNATAGNSTAGNSTVPVPGANATAGNATAGNSTGATGGNRTHVPTVPVPPPTRGATVYCPMCQPKEGKPAVTANRTPTSMTLDSGAAKSVFESALGVPRLLVSNAKDESQSKYVMSLTRFFLSNATGLDGDGTVPPEQRAKQVTLRASLGHEAPYTWAVGAPSTVSDDKVVMHKYSVTGLPKDASNATLVRPTIVFDFVSLASENATISKYDLKIDNFKPAYWQGPAGHNFERFVAVFALQRQDRLGVEANPNPATCKPTAQANMTVPSRPVVGLENRGEETILLNKISAGGIDLAAPATITSETGSTKSVAMALGRDVDGTEAVFYFFERFGASMVHDPYVVLNANSLGSSAAGLSAAAAVAVAAVACVAALFF